MHIMQTMHEDSLKVSGYLAKSQGQYSTGTWAGLMGTPDWTAASGLSANKSHDTASFGFVHAFFSRAKRTNQASARPDPQ